MTGQVVATYTLLRSIKALSRVEDLFAKKLIDQKRIFYRILYSQIITYTHTDILIIFNIQYGQVSEHSRAFVPVFRHNGAIRV